jgi:hypothetical protein
MMIWAAHTEHTGSEVLYMQSFRSKNRNKRDHLKYLEVGAKIKIDLVKG